MLEGMGYTVRMVSTGAENHRSTLCRMMPLAVMEAMAAGIPGAQLVKIEGAGHMPMLEKSEATTAAIRGLLGRIG